MSVTTVACERCSGQMKPLNPVSWVLLGGVDLCADCRRELMAEQA